MTAPLPFTVHAALPCQPHAGFAASLRCALPFDEEASDVAETRLRRLRARLN